MKKMIVNQTEFERNLRTKYYSNGQLAVFLQNNRGEPIAELSIMEPSVDLDLNEFILKDSPFRI